MRTKDVLLNDFDRVKILCQYLYMDENNYIDVDNGLTVLRIRMNEHFGFLCKNLRFPDLPEMNYTEEMSIRQIIGISYKLEEMPPMFNYGHKNRWQEIHEMTLVDTALNKFQRKGVI